MIPVEPWPDVPEANLVTMRVAVDAALAAVTEHLRSDAARNAVARALGQLDPGEDWPTNGGLGGNLTGTRDDEYRAEMLGQADAALAAVIEHLTPTEEST